ncbi:CBS domain containing-hemolysin-like protein [Rhizomicrobium palustre]|uniref:CBS domain containing-hemolysin-like protein n=1 Tax=Rhizomicrobium palustre TaxID=189966 RepID=A0A846N3V7_9PROT|nr:hemolysin family protein [Rhizomicrobium palustre]NIK89921.1 CBS domain containing-hemolysin-like protein [Rhizomicrobium palustre]
MSDALFWDLIGIGAVFLLVAANGFFVAAEFSLVAVRRSRVAELVSQRRTGAGTLQKAVTHLDANLAATQLGITISSLALGWIGEPALAHLIDPMFDFLPSDIAKAGEHSVAIVIAFILITALHIVFGELAPKSLALQKSERTALAIVRPLSLFLFILRPAIMGLNGLGNLVLKSVGLHAGEGEGAAHSAEELKLLVRASHAADILEDTQRDVVVRALNIGQRRASDIMTPRVDIDWLDLDDSPEAQLHTIRTSRHEQLLVGRGTIDEPLGMVLKKDLLNQLLDGKKLDPMAVLSEPLVVHEALPVFDLLQRFRQQPIRLVMIVDEYGTLAGIVTQTDLLEAIAGDMPELGDAKPEISQAEDGTLVFDGMTIASDAFEKLGLHPEEGGYHTIAGFALAQLGQIPETGSAFDSDGWHFEVTAMSGRRITELRARRLA